MTTTMSLQVISAAMKTTITTSASTDKHQVTKAAMTITITASL